MLALGIKGISTIRVPTLRAVNCYQRLLDTSRYFSSETGSVKFYLRRKAYGFITRDTTGDDIFVHRTEISGATSDDPFNPELRAGERVKFTLKDINGKTFATQVTMEDGSLVPKTRDDVRTLNYLITLFNCRWLLSYTLYCYCINSSRLKEFDL